ncbi:MAG: Ig-like domain-containing protein [Lachnospiraceae bacterium]|nr:Ig-like domain-containing protein [Lachnospiraceae bacterium]
MGRKLSCLLGLLLICTLITGLFDTPASAAAKVKLSSTKKTLYAGELFTLELSNAKGTVKWSSSNKKVAVVEDGKVTAVKKGKATITARDSKSGKSYKCKLTVKNNSLSNKKLKLKAGESSGLTLKGNTPAVWTSSDESIVYVSDGT